MIENQQQQQLKQETAQQQVAQQQENSAVDRILKQVETIPDVFYIPEQFAHLWNVAKNLSGSDIIPRHYQGKTANVFIALVRAKSIGIEPFWFMEQTYVYKGKLGVQGKLIIALINKSGILKDRLGFEYLGSTMETRKCRCYGTLQNGKEISFEVSYAMAKLNGWTNPKGESQEPSKWILLTDLMLAYRSAKFLGDTHCPEIVGGLVTIDEVEDSNVDVPAKTKELSGTDTTESKSYVPKLVEKVEIYTGETNGKKWTRYGITINGEQYGTFSDSIYEIAKGLYESKDDFDFTFEEKGKHKNILTIDPIVIPAAVEPQTEDQEHADFINNL